MKRIPKAFQLGGHRFTVTYLDDEELCRKAGAPAYGLFVPGELAIYLTKPTKKIKRSVVLQTFHHELVHAVLWMANHQWANEKLVDQLGHLLHQVSVTAEY